MKPFVTVAEATLEDGTLFTLHEHDGKFYLRDNGHDLMSTELTHSEQLLAEVGCKHLKPGGPGQGKRQPRHPKIVIAGLGLGFTLKRTLEVVGEPATVTVAELVKPVIEWNRTILAEHNGHLLDDPRTDLFVGDFFDCLRKAPQGHYDAILFDIDDAPDSTILDQNRRMYTKEFLGVFRRALSDRGRIAFWMVQPAPRFERVLKDCGFKVEVILAKHHPKAKRAYHRIYLCQK